MHIYSLTSEVEKACREKRRVRSEAQLSLRVNVKCRMAEVCREGTLGSVLAWRAASLLLIRLLFVLKTSFVREKEDKLQSEPVGA